MASLLGLFAATTSCAPKTFLGLLPWYYYLNISFQSNTGTCEITNFTLLGAHSSLLLIGLAIVDDLLRIAGMVAVGFVIWAGIQYIKSQGAPDEAAKAQSTIINALIGLAIALVAVGVVSFLGSQLATGNGGSLSVAGGQLNLGSLPNPGGVDTGSIIQTILGIAFGVIGALSLLFVVLGGFRYITSQGDARNVAQAKNTILYALIGLAVAIAAESIVSGAVGRL